MPTLLPPPSLPLSGGGAVGQSKTETEPFLTLSLPLKGRGRRGPLSIKKCPGERPFSFKEKDRMRMGFRDIQDRKRPVRTGL
jgi:hypothetical protein